MEQSGDVWRMEGAGGDKKTQEGTLKLFSGPPQMFSVFGEMRHAYMWLIEKKKKNTTKDKGVPAVLLLVLFIVLLYLVYFIIIKIHISNDLDF